MKEKEIVLNSEISGTFVKFIVLLAIVFFVPLSGNQLITGPLINAALFVSAFIFGVRGAIIIAVIPSIMALSTEILPSVMAPMIPFIIIGNIVLVTVFVKLKKNYWIAVISASIAKSILLYTTSWFLFNIFLSGETAIKFVAIMGWPQLGTALAGGAIAHIFLKNIKKDEGKV